MHLRAQNTSNKSCKLVCSLHVPNDAFRSKTASSLVQTLDHTIFTQVAGPGHPFTLFGQCRTSIDDPGQCIFSLHHPDQPQTTRCTIQGTGSECLATLALSTEPFDLTPGACVNLTAVPTSACTVRCSKTAVIAKQFDDISIAEA